jgi:hypothetical protein
LALNGVEEVLVRATRGGLFLYSGGKLEALDIPKSTPRVLNKNGIVVGSFGPVRKRNGAFVGHKGHGMRNLNPLIPTNSGWTLKSPATSTIAARSWDGAIMEEWRTRFFFVA